METGIAGDNHCALEHGAVQTRRICGSVVDKATMAPSVAKEHLNRGIAYDELGNYQLAIQVSSASCRA